MRHHRRPFASPVLHPAEGNLRWLGSLILFRSCSGYRCDPLRRLMRGHRGCAGLLGEPQQHARDPRVVGEPPNGLLLISNCLIPLSNCLLSLSRNALDLVLRILLSSTSCLTVILNMAYGFLLSLLDELCFILLCDDPCMCSSFLSSQLGCLQPHVGDLPNGLFPNPPALMSHSPPERRGASDAFVFCSSTNECCGWHTVLDNGSGPDESCGSDIEGGSVLPGVEGAARCGVEVRTVDITAGAHLGLIWSVVLVVEKDLLTS